MLVLTFESSLPCKIELGTLFLIYGYSIHTIIHLALLKGVVVRIVA
jgi:hypothetical protein